ncbi:MAG: restriction endonuclease subunit S [Pirellulaceae bacterium]|nr:restriction endonuclease subunit S [Pirellulaceae bacterium]
MPTPPGWRWMLLTDIARLETGHTPSRTHPEYWDDGDIAWIGIKDARLHHGKTIHDTIQQVTQLGIENSAARRLPAGTVCLSRTASVGYVLVMGREMATSQDFVNWVCTDCLAPEFLMYALIAEGEDIRNFGKGTTHTTIYFPEVKAFHICVPPVNEQRRIVTKLKELFSDLDAGVAALERAKANLKRYRAAVLKAAVEGKLTEAWRAEQGDTEPASKLLERILTERRRKWETDQLVKFAAAKKEPPKNWKEKYVEPTPPDTTGLPELPEGWCWASLGQLLHGIEAGKSFECLTRPAELDEWGVVKVSAMTWGTFLEEEQKAIPPKAAFDPSDEIKPNDMLLSRSNTTQLVGATVLVGNCRPRLLLSDKSLRLRASKIVNLLWLHTAMSSSLARSQLSAMATGTSDSMRNVSQDKIKSVILPLPPIAEHQCIVDETSERLSQIDASDAAINHGLRRAARLRQSILKQAFKGKLVPQDPTDEPASVLLERLRARRTDANGTASVRKRSCRF